jgi:hypothetical protein
MAPCIFRPCGQGRHVMCARVPAGRWLILTRDLFFIGFSSFVFSKEKGLCFGRQIKSNPNKRGFVFRMEKRECK